MKTIRTIPPRALVHEIAMEEATAAGVTAEAILGRARTKAVCAARRRCYLRLRDLGYRLSAIGFRFDGRNHSTVFYVMRGRRQPRSSAPSKPRMSRRELVAKRKAARDLEIEISRLALLARLPQLPPSTIRQPTKAEMMARK